MTDPHADLREALTADEIADRIALLLHPQPDNGELGRRVEDLAAELESHFVALIAEATALRARLETAESGARQDERIAEHLDARIAAEARVTALAQEVERLRAGVQAFLDENYDHPRQHRPMSCRHGIAYWMDCGQCNDEHFTRLLALSQQGETP